MKCPDNSEKKSQRTDRIQRLACQSQQIRATPRGVLYTHAALLDPSNAVHLHRPWAKAAVSDVARAIATSNRGGFPCPFAQATLARGTLYFVFMDSVDDADECAATRDALGQYLKICASLAKREEHMHVLLIMVKPSAKHRLLKDYHSQAWRLMRDWVDNDTAPWPSTVPRDPNDSFWSLCFHSVPLFVNISCPAHIGRPSRNLGRSLVLVTQPRAAFDVVAGPDAKGDCVRAAIRKRITHFDRTPWASYLGTYQRGDLEWPQYGLADSVGDDAVQTSRGCPLHARANRNRKSGRDSKQTYRS